MEFQLTKKRLVLAALLLLAFFLVAAAFSFDRERVGTAFGNKRADDPVLPPANTAEISMEEPLVYPEDVYSYRVEREEFVVGNEFPVGQLAVRAETCGVKRSDAYFAEAMNRYAPGEKGVIYRFLYENPSQDPGIWTVAVIPNRIGYTTLEEFKADFNICAEGAVYPTMLSTDYLAFESVCPTGDDGSGDAHGCQVVKDKVSSVLALR